MEKSSSASSTKNENPSKPSEKQTFEEQSTPEEISEISTPHSSSRKDLAETQKILTKPSKSQENIVDAKIKLSHEKVPDEVLDELAELDALDEEEDNDEKCDEFDQQEDDEDENFEEDATEEQPNPEENAKIDEEVEFIQEEMLIEEVIDNKGECEPEGPKKGGDQKNGKLITANQGLELEQEDKSSVQESDSEESEDDEEISPFSAQTIREMSTDMPPYIFMQNKQKKRFFNRLTSEYLDAMTQVSIKKKIEKESVRVKFQMGLTQIKRFAKKQRLMH